MNRAKLDALIKGHEGLELNVYKDTVGVLTVGYGHALHPGSGITRAAADALYEGDICVVAADYDRLVKDGAIPPGLSEVRQAVLMDMLFNLGRAKFLKFKNFLVALKLGDFPGAVRHMKASLWARQVGRRAERLTDMMETGRWPKDIGDE